MIEGLAKAAIIEKTAINETRKTLKSLDTRKKYDVGVSKVEKNIVHNNEGKNINIDKRKPRQEIKNKRDTKEMISNDLAEVTKNYIKELKQFSEYPETLQNVGLDKIENVSPEKVKQLRLEFRQNKNSLIQQWEKKTGKEWPKYDKDVFTTNNNGERSKIRKIGDYYDAHHIKPLSLGGNNIAENITPIKAENHYDSRGIHRPDGPCSTLQEIARK